MYTYMQLHPKPARPHGAVGIPHSASATFPAVRALHLHNAGSAAQRRPRNSHVAKFKESDVPLDSQSNVKLRLHSCELLGVGPGEAPKDSDINAIYERLAASPVESGFSTYTLEGRQEVLDLARRNIITSKGRAAREQPEFVLPADLLPGAIALMTEVAHNTMALSIGSELLQNPEVIAVPDLVRDIRLTLALANCGLASECLEQDNKISASCSYLEAALRQLQEAGDPPLAPALRAEIQQGLATLRFQAALEQLSCSPGGSKADARKRAVRTVREALKQQADVAAAGSAAAGNAAGTGMTAESVEKLVGVLTCEEVVHLLEWEQLARNPAPHTWMYPGLLEAVAVAHIVHGFACRQPAYVRMAVALLQHLPDTPDLCVVQGVCHLLLGSVHQASDAVKRAEKLAKPPNARASAHEPPLDPRALPASRDALRFVVSQSAGGDDGLLPGLCMLTERWLTEAAFPFFRDTAASPPSASLVRYFDDTRVETLLTVYDEKSSGQLGETVAAAYDRIKRGLKRATMAGMLVTADAGAAGSGSSGAQQTALFRMVAGGAVLVAAVGTALVMGARVTGSGDALAATSQHQQHEPLTVAPESFGKAAATKLLKQWQGVKASALGPEARTELLRSVLAEPMLAEMTDKVATLRGHRCHMRYKVARLHVTDVEVLQVGANGKGAQVAISASMEETANLHDAEGKQINSARHKYNARYTVLQGKDGVWRLSTASIEDVA